MPLSGESINIYTSRELYGPNFIAFCFTTVSGFRLLDRYINSETLIQKLYEASASLFYCVTFFIKYFKETEKFFNG